MPPLTAHRTRASPRENILDFALPEALLESLAGGKWLGELNRLSSKRVSLMRIDIVNCTNISRVVYVYCLHQQSYVD